MNQTKAQLGPLQAGIIVLTIATAIVHLSLLFPDALFILNGVGYLTLLGALYLPIPQLAGRRNLVRWALLGYAVLTIILWVIMGSRIALAYVTKVIEVVLIVLLWRGGKVRNRQGKRRFFQNGRAYYHKNGLCPYSYDTGRV